ncbi:MAG: hypothetical protein AAB592_02790 [Patescibacteria group bacterium]
MHTLVESYEELAVQALERYPRISGRRINYHIHRIRAIRGDVRDLIGLRVLDLGCGSISNTERPWSPLSRLYELFFEYERRSEFWPWYCRILKMAGADTLGVDIASNSDEDFSHARMDLTDPDAMDIFDDESFDAANNNCFTSPADSMRARHITTPAILRRISMKNLPSLTRRVLKREVALSGIGRVVEEETMCAATGLNDRIAVQVARVLKEGGIYTLAEFVYRKKDGVLQRERSLY